MPDDLAVIDKIAEKLGIALEKISMEDLRLEPDTLQGYVVNNENRIIGLRLENVIAWWAKDQIRELTELEAVSLINTQLEDGYFLGDFVNLTFLNLSGNDHITDWTFLVALPKLTGLGLKGNRLTDGGFILNVKRLKFLDVSENEFTDLSYLRHLKYIETLDISKNPNVISYAFINSMKQLKHLTIKDGKVENYSFLKANRNLTFLDLSGNNLMNVYFIGTLSNLTHLNLNKNYVVDLGFLKDLKNLKVLKLNSNELSDDHIMTLNRLKGLIELDLGNNQLTDLHIVKLLPSLKILMANDNELNDATFLEPLKELEFLDLRHNKLKDVSPIKDLKKLKVLDISENPIEEPPPEVCSRGLKGIRDYYRILEAGPQQKPGEIKVHVLGDEGVGKTSLLRRLVGKGFRQSEPKTSGMAISEMNIQDPSTGPLYLGKDKKTPELPPGFKANLNIHFWDFGGGEKYRAAHHLFFSKQGLYMLVADGGDAGALEYWMQGINSIDVSAPVLVIINKAEEAQSISFQLAQHSLSLKYANVIGCVQTDCNTGRGIQKLLDVFPEFLNKTNLLKAYIPQAWMRAKNKLETILLKDHYVSESRFQALCKEEEIMDPASRMDFLERLIQMGAALHFGFLKSEDFYVLHPGWVMTAVYSIIKSEIPAKTGGLLDEKKLEKVLAKEVGGTSLPDQRLKNVSYSSHEQRYLLSLMKAFECCLLSGDGYILIPDLLPRKEPSFTLPQSDKPSIGFRIRYDRLPSILLPKFIVKSHKEIMDNLYWFTGIGIHSNPFNSTALIKADLSENLINIMIMGDRKREYLSVLRKSFEKIASDFKGLKFSEWIPLPQDSTKGKKDVASATIFDKNTPVAGLSRLLTMESNDIENYTSKETGQTYSVQELLNPIIDLKERKKKNSDQLPDISAEKDVEKKREPNSDLQMGIEGEPEKKPQNAHAGARGQVQEISGEKPESKGKQNKISQDEVNQDKVNQDKSDKDGNDSVDAQGNSQSEESTEPLAPDDPLFHNIRIVRKQLELMEKTKKLCDREAERGLWKMDIKIILMNSTLLAVGVLFLLMLDYSKQTTWFFLGADALLIIFSVSNLASAQKKRTKRLEAEQISQYRRHNFNLREYNQLKRELSALEKKVRR